MQASESQTDTCSLCGRPFGQNVQMHHLVPKSQGGKHTIPLHPICHRIIHALFNEKELARNYATIANLHQNADIQAFVKWVKNKAPDFYRRTAQKGGKKRR